MAEQSSVVLGDNLGVWKHGYDKLTVLDRGWDVVTCLDSLPLLLAYISSELFDGLFVNIETVDLVALLSEVASHRQTHITQSEETDLVLS